MLRILWYLLQTPISFEDDLGIFKSIWPDPPLLKDPLVIMRKLHKNNPEYKKEGNNFKNSGGVYAN